MTEQLSTIKVLIVDDQLTFGEALELALAKERDMQVVDVVTDGTAAVRAANEHRPDVVLMDVAMPGMSGIEATRRIKAAEPETQVVILSGYDDELLLGRAVQAGALGLLRKTEAVVDVANTVRHVHRGEGVHSRREIEGALRRLRHRREQDESVEQRLARLTPREVDVLEAMARGRTPEAVAEELQMSPNTVRTHFQNIMVKLGVHSKLEALVLAIRHARVRTVDVSDTDDHEDAPEAS